MPRGQSEGTNLRQQPRLWDSHPVGSPNLRHCQARSHNKGLHSASRLHTGHSLPESDKRGQPELEGSNCSPRKASSTKLKAGLVAKQDFLEFWTVNIHREGRSQRSAQQKRHTEHLRRSTSCTPRKPSGWNRGGDKMHPLPGGDCTHQATGHLRYSDLGRAQNTGSTESAPLWNT